MVVTVELSSAVVDDDVVTDDTGVDVVEVDEGDGAWVLPSVDETCVASGVVEAAVDSVLTVSICVCSSDVVCGDVEVDAGVVVWVWVDVISMVGVEVFAAPVEAFTTGVDCVVEGSVDAVSKEGVDCSDCGPEEAGSVAVLISNVGASSSPLPESTVAV